MFGPCSLFHPEPVSGCRFDAGVRDMGNFDNLLSEGRIGTLTLKNRTIATAAVTDMAGEDGLPTEQFVRFHEEKACGGWGLVITENYAIVPEGKTHARLPALWDDSQVAPHAEFVRRIHEAGGTIGAQLFHPGRVANPAFAGEHLMGPSPLRDPTAQSTPREMSRGDIRFVVDAFASAARRAKEAGFDLVEIHGAHGYLINEFLSPACNKRCDEYGGTLENRARFALEVIGAIRAAVGPDFPISFRFSACDHVPGSNGAYETRALARMIGSSGIDLLNISQGVPASRGIITPPAAIPPAFYAASACKLKEAVDVPIAVVGRISDPAIAEELLASEATDFVGMGRSSLADPQFPLKVAQGRPEDIIPCIACLRGCAGESRRGHAVHCALNPRTGREAEYAECFDLGAGELPEAKSVMVVGGGIAGMEVALVAAARGHDVDLYEAGDKLGGQWRLAAVPPGKQLLASFASWQVRQIEKAGVRVHLNEKVTADAVVAAAPDVVVVATGSVPSIPPIPGLAESPLAVGSWDVLAGTAAVRGKVAVLGGGQVGVETAGFLAEQGARVTIIEAASAIASDAEPIPRSWLLTHLDELGVSVRTDAKVVEVSDSGVYAEHCGVTSKLTGFDTLVTAFGSRSEASLVEEIPAAGFGGRVLAAGDALGVADAFEDLLSAYEAACSI